MGVMAGRWFTSVMILMATWGCVTAQQSGVPAISDADIEKLNDCVGSDQVTGVTGGLAKWRQPCEQLWDNPVWLSRARQSAKWEEELWKLLFRGDLLQATVTPVPCDPAGSTNNAASLTSADKINHAQINATLNNFEISTFLRDVLEQSRRLCIDYSNNINLQTLSFPMSSQLGRQFSFFDCILKTLVFSCGEFKAQQIAINGTDMTASIKSIIDSILG